MRRLAATLTVLALATACVSWEEFDRGLYGASGAVAPTHPVTGRPVFNVIPEDQEIATAQRAWQEIGTAATDQGIAVDPPGARLSQLQAVLDRLVAISHRQHLPWQVHLIAVDEVNALTPGGGMVVVFDGLYGGLVPPDDDDALAAVLAHEIAHVNLLHVPVAMTWRGFGTLVSNNADDPYYQAAYTTEQEAEADRLAALYLALGGFDPMAAPRVWKAAQERYGSSAAQAGFLHDHPLNAERVAITQDAAQQVERYRIAGQKNDRWHEILADNVLFPRTEPRPYQAGEGIVRAVEAAIEVYDRHEEARDEQKDRERAAAQFQSVQIVQAWEQYTTDGRVGVFFDVYNGSSRSVSGLAMSLHYVQGQQILGSDESCQLAVAIAPGQTVRLGCYKHSVPGSTAVVPAIADIGWR